jgi:Vitamin K-dependent gamma-carboxylase
LAKINYTWLIEALPLRIWLPANDALPLIGPLFKLPWMPWAFSWAGMLYDTTIVFWLLWPPTRRWAYVSVLVFHTLTGLLFQIGIFPLVMIGATWIYFSPAFHFYSLFVIRYSLLVIGYS